MRTINGPLWEAGWIKVSEVGDKYPEEQRSMVLGNPEFIANISPASGFDLRPNVMT